MCQLPLLPPHGNPTSPTTSTPKPSPPTKLSLHSVPTEPAQDLTLVRCRMRITEENSEGLTLSLQKF